MGGGVGVSDRAIALPIDDTRMALLIVKRLVMVTGVGWRGQGGRIHHTTSVYTLYMFEMFCN